MNKRNGNWSPEQLVRGTYYLDLKGNIKQSSYLKKLKDFGDRV